MIPLLNTFSDLMPSSLKLPKSKLSAAELVLYVLGVALLLTNTIYEEVDLLIVLV